ncbi:uncharacterized protein EAE98_003839 [Botrytis deweyae]|uniref:Uncharacterized protein n=1 Tax=Botrytis deweyae TaxID=2478750 RepID=A0ABQ7IRW6_9HELO|nr:uncharacterized protein EAE98_003839 [Botrytis deweyae]KAF7932540.1 hypothetical protein EAE98_003839 [Botrytis deweyae]
MATANSNLFTTKRAARRDASYDPGNESNSFAKITRRSSQFPLPVRDDNSISVLEPEVVNVVTKPRIERIEVLAPRESTSDDSDNFNYSSIVLQNVEELYWDPLGEISNFRVGELSASANFSVNIRTESREEVLPIDMHVLEVVHSSPSGKIFKVTLKDTEGLSEYLKQTPIEQSTARFYFLQDVSIHASPIVSRLLGCSINVFRDHFKRASDDVAFLLPSKSVIQDHVVIPYQRCYRRSSAKSICEVQNKRSTFCHGNLVSSEEHVTVWTSRSSQGSARTLIICDGNPKQSGDHFDFSLTMRSRLEIQVQEQYHQDPDQNFFRVKSLIAKVPWMALRVASNEWQSVIRAHEAYMLPGLKPQYLASTEVRLSEKEAFEEYLKQTWSMLKMNIRVIDSLETLCSSWLTEQYKETLKDYQFLENKVMIQMKQNSASIPLLTAMIAVEESRKAIQQANDVKALTVLATVYIPLSFVAGVFGMNVSELNSGIDVDIWVYFAISIPVTIASMVLVWKWEWLTRKVKNFRIRPNNNPSPRKTVSGALFSVGRMTAGIGKPRDVQIGHDLER